MTTLPPEGNNGEGAQQPADAPAPPPPPAAPQYQAPPAGAQPPPPQQPQQPQQAPQYQAAPAPGAGDPVANLQLNYWLSVFFTWIPALIFWLIEKDKGNQRVTAFHVANFNFSLLRIGVMVVAWIFALIPYIGWIIAILLWLGQILLFVFHIMGAAKVKDAYASNGKTDPFIFNIPIIK